MKAGLRVLGIISAAIIAVIVMQLLGFYHIPGFEDVLLLPSPDILYVSESPGATTEPDASYSPAYADIISIKYCRSRLGKNERAVYDTIYNAVDSLKAEVSLKQHMVDVDSLLKVYHLYTLDSPEHYWVENISYYYDEYTNLVNKIRFVYNVKSPEEKAGLDQKLDARVNSILMDIDKNASDYSKVKYVHDHIVSNTAYDKAAEHNQNILSVLLYNTSVCAGYARTTQYLLNRLGVECLYVEGTSRGEHHAWNIVKVDGKYYNLDTTWDDPVFKSPADMDYSSYISYEYFLVTDEAISKTHKMGPAAVKFPACVSTESNYFGKEGLLFDTFGAREARTVAGKIYDNILSRPRFISFRFSTPSAYEHYMDNISSYWYEIARAVNEMHGSDIVNMYQASYFKSDDGGNTVCMVIYYN